MKRKILAWGMIFALVCSNQGMVAYATEMDVEQVQETDVEAQTEKETTDQTSGMVEQEDSMSGETNSEDNNTGDGSVVQPEEVMGENQESDQTDTQNDNLVAAQAENSQTAEELGYVPGEIIVTYAEDSTDAQVEAVAEEKDGEVAEVTEISDVSTAVVNISESTTVEQAVEEYTADPCVESAMPNYLVTLDTADEDMVTSDSVSVNDPSKGNQSYLDQVNATGAWDNLRAQKSYDKTTVVILDTGADINHEDLKNVLNVKDSREVISESSADYSSVYYTLDPLQGDGYKNGQAVDNSQKSSHGTHVAGIIAAEANNGVGIAGVGSVGDNSAINLVAVDVFQYWQDGQDAASIAAILVGMQYAQKIGAKVVNMSLGISTNGSASSFSSMESACNALAAAGITIVCAAGNANTADNGTIQTVPSDYNSTISVISIDGFSNTRSSFSNYGSRKDVCAPGNSIYSTYDNTSFGTAYKTMSGTSMATPIVTAVVAMMYSVDSTLTTDEVRTLLRSTATDIGNAGFDIYTAYGKVNAQLAVKKTIGIYEPQTVATGVYTISSKLSTSKVIDIAGGSTGNSANAQMYSSNETLAQRFYIEWHEVDNTGRGYYTIKNVRSGKYLDAAGGASSNGTNVQQYTGNGTNAQKWIITAASSGYYTLMNASGDKVLDIAGGSTANCANVQLYSSNGTNAQQFSLNACQLADIDNNTIYTIYNVANSSRVVDVSGASKNNSANIQLYNANGTVAQQFKFVYDASTGYYSIWNVNSNKVIDVSGGSGSCGANIQQYSYNGTNAQKWSLKKSGSYYVFYNAGSGLCFDLHGGSTANGTNIWQYTSNGTNAQKWKIIAK